MHRAWQHSLFFYLFAWLTQTCTEAISLSGVMPGVIPPTGVVLVPHDLKDLLWQMEL